MPEDPVDTSVLRELRQACHQAKDVYFGCLDKHLPSIKAEGPAVPRACKQQRLDFEAACKSSWVKHFDALRDKRLQTLQKLQATISRTGQKAAGSIAGEQQKTSRG
eukprot:jgi/Astpho2/1997/Aster-x1054